MYKLNELQAKHEKAMEAIKIDEMLIALANTVGTTPWIVYNHSTLYGAVGGLGFRHSETSIVELLEKLPPVKRVKFNHTFCYDIPELYKDTITKKKNLPNTVFTCPGNSWEYTGPKLTCSGYNSVSWYTLINGLLVSVSFDLCGYNNPDMSRLVVDRVDIMGGTEIRSSQVVNIPQEGTTKVYKTGGGQTEPTYYYCFNTTMDFIDYCIARGLK